LIVVLCIVLFCLRRKKQQQQPGGKKHLSARAELDGTSRGNLELSAELKNASSPAAQSIAPAYDTIMAQNADISPQARQFPQASYFPAPVAHSPLTPHTPTYSPAGNVQSSPEHHYHQTLATQSPTQQYAYQQRLYGQWSPLREQCLHPSGPLPYNASADPNHHQHFPPPPTPVNASSIAQPPSRLQHPQGDAGTLPERHPSSSSAYTDSMYAEPPTQTNTPARFYPGHIDVATANSERSTVSERPRSSKRSPGLGTGGGRFLEGD